MVVTIKETAFEASSSPYLILQQDPRRIRYEIFLNPANLVTPAVMYIGSPAAIDSDNAIGIELESLVSSIPIVRDFRSDLEAVCLPVMVSDPSAQMLVSVRETLLTPAPVDEVPVA